MLTGSIKNYMSDRGFGFITPDEGGKDCFFHIADLAGIDEQLVARGLRVSYRVEQTDRGPKAVRLAVLSGAAVTQDAAADDADLGHLLRQLQDDLNRAGATWALVVGAARDKGYDV